jgi:hypothetical protein
MSPHRAVGVEGDHDDALGSMVARADLVAVGPFETLLRAVQDLAARTM